MDITVERYSLHIDTRTSLDALMAGWNTDIGEAWADVMRLANDYRVSVFILSSDADVSGFDPYALPTDDIVEQYHTGMHNLLPQMHKAGYVQDAFPNNVWFENSSDAYISEGRGINWVHVEKGFTLVSVVYFDYAPVWPHGDGRARQWRIDETVSVREGTYVIASRGDFAMPIHSVGFSFDGEPSAEFIAEVEGFSASYADAQCDTCHENWSAYGGSWKFEPEYGSDAITWHFDDAEDFDNGTIACPVANCSGRIGFLIH